MHVVNKILCDVMQYPVHFGPHLMAAQSKLLVHNNQQWQWVSTHQISIVTIHSNWVSMVTVYGNHNIQGNKVLSNHCYEEVPPLVIVRNNYKNYKLSKLPQFLQKSYVLLFDICHPCVRAQLASKTSACVAVTSIVWRHRTLLDIYSMDQTAMIRHRERRI